MNTQQEVTEENADAILKQSIMEDLLQKLYDAHSNAAGLNAGNISSSTAMIVYDGSRNPIQALSAAILSIGGKHAPVTQCRNLIAAWDRDNNSVRNELTAIIQSGNKVPGLGNSFFKDSIDPSFQAVYECYVQHAGKDNPIDRIVGACNYVLSEVKGKEVKLYPNAALITAAVSQYLNMPIFYEISIFIEARMPVWLNMMSRM